MDPSPSRTDAVRVVTLRSIVDGESRASLESNLESASGAPKTPASPALVERYHEALEKITAATEEAGADVLITVQDRAASLLQSRLAEGGDAGAPLQSGGLEAKFGDGLAGGDWWGWIKSVFDHVDKDEWHPIVRPPDDKVSTFADSGRVAVLSDWGTNLYGAPVSAASIKKAGNYELLLHLGDIYYSGTKAETKERFLDVWPTSAGKVSRAINGNHEMYSGGFAYFDDILPAFKQPSSYFATQNTHWLLIGLDTAHTDHALDTEQVRWLKSVVSKAGTRKVILLSHHQPFSRLEKQGPKLQAALADLLQGKAITAWYWGHEHECIVYDKHAQFGLFGRCVGHGGIPAPRKAKVTSAATEQSRNGIAWKRLPANADSPSCLVLDGRNPLIKGEEDKFGPHGYLTLEFDGPSLTERIHLPDGTEILKGRVA